MNSDERREASRAFSDTLREKVAASREGLRLEDLMGRGGAEQDTAPGGQSEAHEDEGEGPR